MPAVFRLARNSRQTSRPVFPGITQSRIASTGPFSSRRCASAVVPSSVTVSSNSEDSNCNKSLRKSGSSSAIRIFTRSLLRGSFHRGIRCGIFLPRPANAHLETISSPEPENFSTETLEDRARGRAGTFRTRICKIFATPLHRSLYQSAKAVYCGEVPGGVGHDDPASWLCLSYLRIERTRFSPALRRRQPYCSFSRLNWVCILSLGRQECSFSFHTIGHFRFWQGSFG